MASKNYKKAIKDIPKDIKKRVKHEAKILTEKEVEENRSSAYKYLKL